jgi:uncharacterized hydrophobic protein (TIGR00271 family)
MPIRKLFKAKPKLTSQKEAYDILASAAKPDRTYYVLTAVAAVIATLGLLLDSIPVIIGAMLVAPLMTPVLAIGLSLSRGDLKLVRQVIASVAGGALAALLFSTAVAILAPGFVEGRYVTALTEPTLLDLGVAFAAGLAGAYTFVYKHLSASLPGVAIAAALVPPLGAVGIGIGNLEPAIIFGAGLLFLANIIAIGLAATLVFIALGYSPMRGKKGREGRATALKVAIALALLVAVPMAYFLATDIGFQNRENKVNSILNEYFPTKEGYSVAAADWFDGEKGETLVLTLTGPGPPTNTTVDAATADVAKSFGRSAGLEIRFVPYYVYEEGKWK